MTKYCVYITIYIKNDLPKFYIGSSSLNKIKNGYKGSVMSKEYKKQWNFLIKNHPEYFKTIILSTYNSREEAYLKESFLHKKLNVINNPLYFNKSFARSNGKFGGGFIGKKHTSERNSKLSKIFKGRNNYWLKGKKKPEHSERMKGNQFAKGNVNTKHSERMKGNQFAKGLLYWNNGIINKRSKTSPGSEWSRGMCNKI